jgi:hypothetical protein
LDPENPGSKGIYSTGLMLNLTRTSCNGGKAVFSVAGALEGGVFHGGFRCSFSTTMSVDDGNC